ncbi:MULTISPECIES: ABC transporter permease [unclassified Butyrivibrio]|uniref:ABC transporter permease n=1 Tax=unclassified Butyrivibrio TaxID=2639466 RepID=UPI000419AB3F|nr:MULTISPECIES: ABC transporter permease [unclassified Butyrivibrio]
MKITREDIKLILSLVKNDLKSRYSGSALGIVWAYVQPLITVLVFWYVFQVGFRNPPVNNVQFILWFVAGYIPWTFFNDGLLSSTNVFYEYSYLVKKMKFKVWQLPIIKVLSSLCIHLFLMLFVIFLYLIYGYKPTIAWLSVPYYSLCVMMLLVGLSYLVGAVSVFFKDAAQLVNIILQLGFWMTPVFWAPESMNAKVIKVLRFNPLYYIFEGNRDALIEGRGFWQQSPMMTLYFWIVVAVLILLGMKVYKTLRIHFSDLL